MGKDFTTGERCCFVLLAIMESDTSLPLAGFSVLLLSPVATLLYGELNGW